MRHAARCRDGRGRVRLKWATRPRLDFCGNLKGGHLNSDCGHADRIAILEEVESNIGVADLERTQVKDDGRAVLVGHDGDVLAGGIKDTKEGRLDVHLYRQMFVQGHFLHGGAVCGPLNRQADYDRDRGLFTQIRRGQAMSV